MKTTKKISLISVLIILLGCVNISRADVCFLPDGKGCEQVPYEEYGGVQNPTYPKDCFATKAEAMSARTSEMDSYYKNGDMWCIKSSCSGYNIASMKPGGWECLNCNDANSKNYNKYKCTCDLVDATPRNGYTIDLERCEENPNACPSYASTNCVPDECHECNSISSVNPIYSGNKECLIYNTVEAHCPDGFVSEEPAGGCYSTQDMVCGSGKCYKATETPECSGEGKRLVKANGVCSCVCKEGYHDDNGNEGCDQNCAVVTCNAVTVPSNAHGTTTCQSIKSDCSNNGSAVYTAWECDSGFHKNSAGNGCDQNCAVVTCNAVTVPSNAHGTTTCQAKNADCSNNGSAVYTAWECDSGFHKNSAGNGCDQNCAVVTCNAVTVPSNAHGTTTCQPKKSDCSNNGNPVYTAWECNSGYHDNGNGGCAKDCTPSCPAGTTPPKDLTCGANFTKTNVASDGCGGNCAVCQCHKSCYNGYKLDNDTCSCVVDNEIYELTKLHIFTGETIGDVDGMFGAYIINKAKYVSGRNNFPNCAFVLPLYSDMYCADSGSDMNEYYIGRNSQNVWSIYEKDGASYSKFNGTFYFIGRPGSTYSNCSNGLEYNRANCQYYQGYTYFIEDDFWPTYVFDSCYDSGSYADIPSCGGGDNVSALHHKGVGSQFKFPNYSGGTSVPEVLGF